MFDKIVFYELRHYGDFHITRQFVRYVIENVLAKQYTYVLKISPKSLLDFPQVTFESYNQYLHPFTDYSPWKIVDNTLYVNTSCGAGEMRFYEGTTIQTAYRIFDYYLEKLCNHTIRYGLDHFIPQIDYQKYQIGPIDKALAGYRDKKKVLIVNGNTMSGQSDNFDMSPLILCLALRNPEVIFFVANTPPDACLPLKTEKNIMLCKDIIGIQENDIVETSYFSRFCDLIVGRTSGVYTLSIERWNIDSKKKWICFSHTERDKDLGVGRIRPEMAYNFIWKNDYHFVTLIGAVEDNLK